MFSSIGWVEIFFIGLLALIIIGPERLPNVIQDVRAAIFAARKAINNAKKELNGDFEGIGKEFDSIREPLSQAAEWGRMGPRAAITKALFDGDDSAWDDFNPKKLLEEPKPLTPENTAQPNFAQQYGAQPAQQPAQQPVQQQPQQQPQAQAQPQQQVSQQQYQQHQYQAQNNPPRNPNINNQGYAGGGFSWADIT
ncbi:MAG: Sec-independent protein translocase TatB [Corynebacterium casei]|uniref:Sec-independent protein translocase TatB n=1 Tax=Corynebacterium casei TaxID=160386 RepID=UPI0026482F9A|nr:Sec-independent protein translocase TatB [Corynebacterium casei]MDN5784667.1 Sec-independent protein translocase TatB [Corynebacterium casei]MDN5903605.1 Sec-independent protein translocase TatB [Corynebacterium casei]MDN6695340.1 Sec-independent protein translocase TatB [Corynebacterium casei]